MTTSEPARRSSVASALILVAVLLLFGAATFVAGLAIGGGEQRHRPGGPVRIGF